MIVPIFRSVSGSASLGRQFGRQLSVSSKHSVPYNPDDRPPMTDHQKKIYPQVDQEFTEEGYPVLQFLSKGRSQFDRRAKRLRAGRREVHPRLMSLTREERMSPDQDWPSTWPTAKTLNWKACPLPLRQSWEEPGVVSRSKYANTELVKIANFLHLSPGAIERHCKALKKFCTQWPQGLETDEEVRQHFPVTYVTRDYVHASPSIRDARARIVDIVIDVRDLKLSHEDLDKLTRLARDRYDKETCKLTISVSACPLKAQNQDYADYLLTALYFESINHEDWEQEKPECDWEKFFWEKSSAKERLKDMVKSSPAMNIDERALEEARGPIADYRKSLEQLHERETIQGLETYRESVEKLLGIKETART